MLPAYGYGLKPELGRKPLFRGDSSLARGETVERYDAERADQRETVSVCHSRPGWSWSLICWQSLAKSGRVWPKVWQTLVVLALVSVVLWNIYHTSEISWQPTGLTTSPQLQPGLSVLSCLYGEVVGRGDVGVVLKMTRGFWLRRWLFVARIRTQPSIW